MKIDIRELADIFEINLDTIVICQTDSDENEPSK